MGGGSVETGAGRSAAGGRRAPTISIVIASAGERQRLERCLDALRTQCNRVGAEVVVARAGPRDEMRELARRFGWSQFVMVSPGASEADLRAAGLRAARGDVVALTSDDRESWAGYVAHLTGGGD